MKLWRISLNLVIFLFLLTIAGNLSLSGQDIKQNLTRAFEEANENTLSDYFGEQLTINIRGEEKKYGKNEAKKKMSVFFNNHPCESFKIQFEGGKSNSSYIIGRLKTENEIFRINVFFRNSDTGKKIHLLRIEEENDSRF